jgi:hypothetical protein
MQHIREAAVAKTTIAEDESNLGLSQKFPALGYARDTDTSNSQPVKYLNNSPPSFGG